MNLASNERYQCVWQILIITKNKFLVVNGWIINVIFNNLAPGWSKGIIHKNKIAS